MKFTELMQSLEAGQLLEEIERFAHMGTWVWEVEPQKLRWSEGMSRILGYEPTFDQHSLEAFFARVHPDDVERVSAATAAAADGRSQRTFEYRLLLPGGQVRHVRVLSLVMTSEGPAQRLVGTVLDVTEVEVATEQLQRTNDSLADAQRIGHLGSFEVAMSGDRTPCWSSELYRILDLDPGTPASLELFVSRLHPDDRARIMGLIEGSLATGKVLPSRARVVKRDGSLRHVDMRADVHKGPSGEPLSIRGTVHDVTDLVGLEAQFHQSQKMEAVGQLAGGLAHDYNNLLTVILGNAETLLAELKRPELREIVSAATTATTVTNRLLAFTRQARGTPRVCDLSREVEGAVQLLRRAVGDGVTLRIDLGDGPHMAQVDNGQVEQMLLNLVINARDAMPPSGTIAVRIAREALDEARAQDHDVKVGEYVTLTVSDTGHGMDEATQRRVFEPFFTTKQPGHGTGLGLSMVFGAMRQCHGFVELTSAPGKGATFKLWFPYVEAAPEGPRSAAPAPATHHAHILLVEDNPAVSRVTAAMLKAGGYSVDVLASATEALAAWRAQPRDLLVTDVAMPDITGVKLVEMLSAEYPTLRVLFVTGYASEQLGANLPSDRVGVLTKPFRHAELLAKVRALLPDKVT